ncbi:TRAP transporter small permease subunit [Bradyrhizobium pachyrhizi]|uniref:TRAP transporter small permease protein n=1 Tax=Bradyrhizobium pachyrhizi TaxID=280333 RepID=A0A844SKX0_9BRAD|nr:TRAP transporter small permease [Bradyrhizobium pachyrhizi]MVT64584.1 TRAP transporter small permease subunit [Bradyrhizobium pachyrhizi]WFU59257.1 TRAP transporter small permease [Bradyrhizobium pachyrhizi]
MAGGIEIKDVAPDGAVHFIDNVSSGPGPVENASEALCALFLVAMIILIGAEAIARNVFSTSLQITDEIGGYLLVATTFLSMSVAEAHGAFHRVELIQARLGQSARIVSQIIFDLMSLIAAAFVTWQLGRLVMNSWRSEDVAPTPLQTPLWLPQTTMALGMLLLCFALVRTILVKIRHLQGSMQR